VIVIVIVADPVIVAVHVHGNDPVDVIAGSLWNR
jgi:dihydroxyacetone kinase-like predicted kinase